MKEDHKRVGRRQPDPEISAGQPQPGPQSKSKPVGEREPDADLSHRREILRALFRQPQYNQCDGLDDYDRDFQQFQLPPDSVRTARQNRPGHPDPNPTAAESPLIEQPGFEPEVGLAPTSEYRPSRRRRENRGGVRHDEFGTITPHAVLDPERCAYDRMGLEGCRRCLDLCPTQAVMPQNGRVQINSDRCRGCGICATACPAGAITSRHPRPQDLLVLLRLEIDAAVEAGVHSPAIAFVDRNTPQSLRDHFESPASEVIAIDVQDVAAVGMETWLNALVYGAGCVLPVIGPATPAETVQELSVQQVTADLLVKGLGYEAARIVVIGPENTPLPQPLPDRLLPVEAAVTVFHPFTDKRSLIHKALEILHRHGPRPKTAVDLPVAAPFGTVILNRDACTLCSACADICPTGALSAGGRWPQLRFAESACVQCGLCRRVCPEGALGLFPRYVYDRRQSDGARTLHQEQPLQCIRCGKPFAAPGMIRRLETALAGHWMYADTSSRRRLEMCHACRLADLLGVDTGN